MQNRPNHVEQNDVEKYDKRRHNLNLKKKIFKSIYGDPEEDQADDGDESESVKSKAASTTVTSTEAPERVETSTNTEQKKKKRKKQQPKPETAADRRLKTFSINPKKFKNKLKYGKNKNRAD